MREVPGSIPGAALLHRPVRAKVHDNAVMIFQHFISPWLVFGNCLGNMVPRGLEPRTLRLLAVRSNQLSYETSECGFYRSTYNPIDKPATHWLKSDGFADINMTLCPSG